IFLLTFPFIGLSQVTYYKSERRILAPCAKSAI
ncbi:MAG: hypothetical protein JWN63_2797, partial [Candidatus Acidoferrum typicum]|nr:hypothetical protein [Candidatus Acidoferrum typicum]